MVQVKWKRRRPPGTRQDRTRLQPCIQHPRPRGCGSACPEDTSSFCHGPLQKARRSISEQRRGPPGSAEADAEGATSPHKHPSSTVPSSILPPAATAGMLRGRFLPDTPGRLLPLPLNSFHLPRDARGKFGLGRGTPLCLAGGGRDDRTGVLPCHRPGRKDARGEM